MLLVGYGKFVLPTRVRECIESAFKADGIDINTLQDVSTDVSELESSGIDGLIVHKSERDKIASTSLKLVSWSCGAQGIRIDQLTEDGQWVELDG